MKVHWFEQSLADVPVENDWFSAWESVATSSFAHSQASGRLAAGPMDCQACGGRLLKSAADPGTLTTNRNTSGCVRRARGFSRRRARGVSISLSHRRGIAVCAVGEPDAMLGCDVEVVEPRSDAFVADYFTPEEQAMTRQAPEPVRFALIALIWSAKESALKTLRTGLRSDTRCVSVALDDSSIAGLNHDQIPPPENLPAVPRARPTWRPLRVSYSEEQVFPGWWFCSADLVRTLVSIPVTEELMISEVPATALPLRDERSSGSGEPSPRASNSF